MDYAGDQHHEQLAMSSSEVIAATETSDVNENGSQGGKSPDLQATTSDSTLSTNQTTSSENGIEENTMNDQQATTPTSAAPTSQDDTPGDREFTPFPKLPVELRHKIWKNSFKKRHVELDIRSLYMDNLGTAYDDGPDPAPSPYIPATLSVNRESRAETMRFYHAVYVPDSGSRALLLPSSESLSDSKCSPGWVNPAIDSIFFRHVPAACHYDKYVNWFDHMATLIPGGLKHFRELEVRHVWLDEGMREEMEESPEENRVVHLFEHILRFPGLKTVVLTGDNMRNFVPTDDELEELRTMAEEFLEENKKKFTSCVAPVVRVRQHVDLYTGEPAFD
jgi:hypothetical protein